MRSLHNSRQGMSIVAGIDIVVEDSEFSWTGGACPQAGIDVEPSSNAEPIHNLTLRRLLLRNNTGAGIQLPVDPYPYLPGGLPLSIALEDVHVVGANWSAVNDGCTSAGIGFIVGPMKSIGSISFANCSASELPSAGLLVQGKAQRTIDAKGKVGRQGAYVVAARLDVRNFTLRHTALRPREQHGTAESPLILAAIDRAQYNWTMGNISLDNLLVIDTLRRPWLSAAVEGPYSVQGPLTDVRGSARVMTPYKEGCSIDASPTADVRINVSCSAF